MCPSQNALFVSAKIWGWLLVKKTKVFFLSSFSFTWEPAHLNLWHSPAHFWARSQSRDEKVCFCFVNACSSPCVLTVNKLPKWLYFGTYWCRGHWAAPWRHLTPQPCLAGIGGLWEEPCSFPCNYMLLAFLSGFSPTLLLSGILIFSTYMSE